MIKRPSILFILFLILLLIVLPVFLIGYVLPNIVKNSPGNSYRAHIVGGFSIDTPEGAVKASKDGVEVAFEYVQPPTQNDELGQKLQSLHTKVIDGFISSYLYYYECHRTEELKPALVGPGQYCQADAHPELTDENVLLATIATHLKQVKNNPLIIGYWGLDDWVQWDAGNARPLLIKIHELVQRYTPHRPMICGFGGSIAQGTGYGWEDWIAANFSPQGCDWVGLYIYTSTLSDTIPHLSSNAYNWSMARLLPAIFSSLKERGWDITKEPLLGIGQAFGGPIKNTNRYWVTPTAKDIETQSRSFCENGATGLAFYAWDDSAFGPMTQTPMNSPGIQMGIHNGISTCKVYWKAHPTDAT